MDLGETGNHDDFLPQMLHVRISALTGEGIQDLLDQWTEALEQHIPSPTSDRLIVNGRHAQCLFAAETSLRDAIVRLREDAGVVLALSDMRLTLDSLGEIVSGADNEDMLDRLFQTFCIGK